MLYAGIGRLNAMAKFQGCQAMGAAQQATTTYMQVAKTWLQPVRRS
jgi:hypothetical protein